jgi:hypothetical protein
MINFLNPGIVMKIKSTVIKPPLLPPKKRKEREKV